MASYTHFYLLRLQFLGYRYSGWQKQDNRKTVQGMLDKTIEFLLPHARFRTLGSGRTDAKVSADDFVVELFLFEALQREEFIHLLNTNLPQDIRVVSMEETSKSFNVLQDVTSKDYHYHFCYGEKFHPANAPFLAHLGPELDIPLMKEAAKLYVGEHNFKRFVGGPLKTDKNYTRMLLRSEIVSSEEIYSSHSPEHAFIFKVRAKGFMRYQVRLMMGALEELGRHQITIDQFKNYLTDPEGTNVNTIAPGSGLRLHKVNYELIN